MLTLKIMDGKSKPDSDQDKEYKLVSDILDISFVRTVATKYERNLLGLNDPPKGKVWTICLAKCRRAGGQSVEQTYLLTGNCYVLNEQGKTVDTYWPLNRLADESEFDQEPQEVA